jgi:hypothetical protein
MFQKSERLRNVYKLCFGILYNNALYLELHFLSLTQAVEAFHRQVMDEEEYKKVFDQIVLAIPSELDRDLQDSIKTALQYS